MIWRINIDARLSEEARQIILFQPRLNITTLLVKVVHGGEDSRKYMEEKKLVNHFKKVELLASKKSNNSKQETKIHPKLSKMNLSSSPLE